MEQSILKSTKRILGIGEDYTAFDLDVLTWVNSAFSTLRDLGLGAPGFSVDSDAQTWSMFMEDEQIVPMIKTYIFLRTKVMFDPPSTAFHMTAMQEQIKEQEFRLGTHREGRDWVPPTPPEEVEQ